MGNTALTAAMRMGADRFMVLSSRRYSLGVVIGPFHTPNDSRVIIGEKSSIVAIEARPKKELALRLECRKLDVTAEVRCHIEHVPSLL